MTSMEFLGGNEAVNQRTAKLASEVGQAAALRIRDILSRPLETGVITQDQVDAIAIQKHVEAAAGYTAERHAGKHNDIYSFAVGLTALLRARAVEDFREQRDSRRPTFFEPSFEKVDTPGEEPLYRARFSEGAFIAPENSSVSVLTIIPDAEVRYEGFVRDKTGEIPNRDNSLRTSAFLVVRIEGDSGELWQNTFFTPEGIVV